MAGAYNNSRGFLCCAFDKEEQNRILETEVVQDANPYYNKSDGSPLINGSNTRDKVFLPSFSEVTKEEYGLCCTKIREDAGFWQCNQASNISTDYSSALVFAGRDVDIERYWLRTTGYAAEHLMYVGDFDGTTRTFGYPCTMDNLGIAPALNVSYRLSDCIKINFNTNGVGEIESQILLGSNYAKEPEEPKKEDYVFGGWYTDAACTQPYHFNRKLTEDTTLYAKWNSYVTVSFQTNGGEGIAPQTIVEGSPAKKPADPKKKDYVFTGWYLDKDCKVLYDFKQGIKGNTVLYAGWRQREPERNEVFIKGNVSYKVTSSSAKTIEYCEVDAKRAKTLKSITIPSTVAYKNITYKVTGIGKNACRNYKKLKKITIGKNITSIGSNAFYGCSKLTSVIYKGTKVTKIGNGAFRKCSSLKSVTIPKAVKEIGKDAFRDCKKLSKITFKGTVLKKVGKNAFKNINKKAVFKVPKKKYKAYKKLLKKNVGYKSSMKIKK